MTVSIPLRLPSASNLREHWSVRHKRVKAQRAAVTLFLGNRARPALPVIITLTRIAPRSLDGDNAQGAMKATRDAVAAWLGVDDADPRVRWDYAQRRGGAREYGVEVSVTSLDGATP